MANQIFGKVIAISDKMTIQSKDASKQPMEKRQLFIDCTRYDPLTGERGFENTPLLEFSHKGLEKLEALIGEGLKKGDIVVVSFDIRGYKYKDKDGNTQVFTSVNPYDIELCKTKGQPEPEPAQQVTQPANDDLPF